MGFKDLVGDARFFHDLARQPRRSLLADQSREELAIAPIANGDRSNLNDLVLARMKARGFDVRYDKALWQRGGSTRLPLRSDDARAGDLLSRFRWRRPCRSRRPT